MPSELNSELAIYTRAMPGQVHTDVHRWDEKSWLTRWQEPMTKAVAQFWFMAATAPERLVDTSRLKSTAKFLKHAKRPEDLAYDVAIRRLKNWQSAFNKHYDKDRFFTQIPLVGLLRYFFDLSTSFAIVRESYDEKFWPAAVQFLGKPDSAGDRESLRNWLAARPPNRSERLLRVNLVAVVGTSADALAILLDDYESKRTPGRSSFALAEALDRADWLKWAKAVAPELDAVWMEQVFRKLGNDAGPYLTTRILATKRRLDFEPIIEALASLEDSRTVGPLLALYGRPETSRAAENILKQNDQWVADGLEAAKEIRGKIGRAAATFEAQSKNRQTSKRNLPSLPAAEYPLWLRKLATTEKPAGLPQYASLKRLPELQTAGHMASFNKDVIYGFLQGLKQLDTDGFPDWALRAQDFFEFESLREFIWTLFHEFSRHGIKPEHFWIIDSVGVFGDEELLFRVMPYAEDWALAGKYQAAERLLQAIAAHQSETSMTMLSRHAASSRAKFVRATAGQLLARISARRGLSPEDLEDRSIDDAGLTDGQHFDYGTRYFTLGLGPNFKVVAIDEAGQTTPGLPRARKSDDPELVIRAKADFALTKQRVNQVVRTQKTRLENAMIHGRRWRPDAWQRTFVSHPIMRFLATRVVWAAFDVHGKVRFTFRMTDEETLASIHDTDVTVPDDLQIGLVHPLEIPPESRMEWQERLIDYEIIPPFEQMGRQVFSRPREAMVTFQNHAIESGWLRGHFAARGWEVHVRDGMITDYSKSFPNAGLKATLKLHPGILFSGGPKRNQLIRNLHFETSDIHSADVVTVSEVLLDAHSIVDRNLA